jgi:hypothetical protein
MRRGDRIRVKRGSVLPGGPRAGDTGEVAEVYKRAYGRIHRWDREGISQRWIHKDDITVKGGDSHGDLPELRQRSSDQKNLRG